jgi:hypothetical protein
MPTEATRVDSVIGVDEGHQSRPSRHSWGTLSVTPEFRTPRLLCIPSRVLYRSLPQ